MLLSRNTWLSPQAAIITDAGMPDLRAPVAEMPSPKITAREAEQETRINVGI
jgi:hypothetical protein